MQAIILAAGYGTRMYPLTENFPKPLLKVGGRPVLDYLMEQLSDLGMDQVHLVTNARYAKHFHEWGRSRDIQIYDDGTASNEARLGGIGDLALVLEKAQPSRVLVTAGDNIYRWQLKPYWKMFLEREEHHVFALREIDREKLRRTGVLELEGDIVRALHEKPADPHGTWACPPLYFFQASLWDTLGTYISMAQDKKLLDGPGYLVRYLCTREKVRAFRVDGARLDIGSIETYRAADEILYKEGAII